MRQALPILLFLSGCATVPVSIEAGRVPVEVVGHVTRACSAPQPQSNVPVTLRAAGEPDALETTQTDANGAFSFRVAPAGEPALYIEFDGKKAMATQPSKSKGRLVAELSLPCSG